MRGRLLLGVTSLALVALPVAPAWAHTDRPHDTTPTTMAPAAPVEPDAHADEMTEPDGHTDEGMMEPEAGVADGMAETEAAAPALMLEFPDRAEIGEETTLRARLRDAQGRPVPDVAITFFRHAGWGGWLESEASLGRVLTDDQGVATLRIKPRWSGEVELGARFDGGPQLQPMVEEVMVAIGGDRQLYDPDVGLDVPALGVWWLLLAVAAVWAVYALVASLVVGIARSAPADESGEPEGLVERRGFLRKALLPAGLTAGVVGLGGGLVALIARSPRTHDNLISADQVGAGRRHRLTPIARVGRPIPMRELPELLDREVSFSKEVLPIFLEKAGPHAHVPKNSPIPNGIRLDSYEALMAKVREEEEEEEEGGGGHGHAGDAHGALIVPGEPMESRLVTVLLDPSMQMPPSIPPLPEGEIQIIATWVAQGAKDN